MKAFQHHKTKTLKVKIGTPNLFRSLIQQVKGTAFQLTQLKWLMKSPMKILILSDKLTKKQCSKTWWLKEQDREESTGSFSKRIINTLKKVSKINWTLLHFNLLLFVVVVYNDGTVEPDFRNDNSFLRQEDSRFSMPDHRPTFSMYSNITHKKRS